MKLGGQEGWWYWRAAAMVTWSGALSAAWWTGLVAFVLAMPGLALAQVTVPAGQVEIGFSPRRHAMDLEVKAIDSARQSVDIEAYDFTSRRMLNALRDAIGRGVTVRVACDAKANVRYGGSIAAPLAAMGAYVHYVDAYPIMHEKVTIVDGVTTETGSMNYTAAGDLHNRENALVFWNNRQVAAVYEQDFEELFEMGKSLN